MAHQGQRLILSEHANPGQPGIHHITEAEINDPVNTAEGDRRLGPFFDQQVETAADPASQQQYERILWFSHRSTLPASSNPGHLSRSSSGEMVTPRPILVPAGTLLFQPTTAICFFESP